MSEISRIRIAIDPSGLPVAKGRGEEVHRSRASDNKDYVVNSGKFLADQLRPVFRRRDIALGRLSAYAARG